MKTQAGLLLLQLCFRLACQDDDVSIRKRVAWDALAAVFSRIGHRMRCRSHLGRVGEPGSLPCAFCLIRLVRLLNASQGHQCLPGVQMAYCYHSNRSNAHKLDHTSCVLPGSKV